MTTRDIKRRIKSISNIRQITRAMQMVSTSKMRRSQKKSKDADAYAQGALEILENITRISAVHESPFWHYQKSNAVGFILITTDRGFCGGLNISLLTKVMGHIKSVKENGKNPHFVTVGKKGRDFIKKIGCTIIADFSGLNDYFTLHDISPITHIATHDFTEGKFERIFLCYNEFVNTLTQKPTVRELLPLSIAEFKTITEMQSAAPSAAKPQYLFEPDAEVVFESLIPYLIEIEVYKAILEGRASEHSARMVAMKNATEKAYEVIGDLTFTYNQVRQAGITKEIAEISSGSL